MHPGSRQGGFTYLLALVAVTAVGIAAAATAEIWSTTRQREKEAELIWVGNQFRQAIGVYYERSPGAIKQYPHTLEDLLEDRRYISIQRYLRRIYTDPLTGQADWIPIQGAGGGIAGIRSASTASTASTINEIGQKGAGGDWRFVYEPAAKSQMPAGASPR